MAITQPSLITWQAVEASGDLKKIRRILENLGDEQLMVALEDQRKGRRDDYPIRAVWNTILAGIILGHTTVEGFLRELRRNAELRQLLGYDPVRGSDAVPPGYVITRLVGKLVKHLDLVSQIFHRLVAKAFELIPDFGKNVAVDGKAIKSVMTKDREAAFGAKATTDALEKILTTWFGFKIHCISDVATELPIAFEVTKASAADCSFLLPLLKEAKRLHPELAERIESLAADKGYDKGEDKMSLFIDHNVLPIIPSRDLQKGEYRPLFPGKNDTIHISPTGEVCCRHDPGNKDREKQYLAMQYQGFEADRCANRFQCPAATFGVECKNSHNCKSSAKDQGRGRAVRVHMERDPRVHLPVYQHSRRFEELYKGRTSIERLFGRLDHMFGMEAPLRSKGLAKAKLRVTLAMSAMMATALGWLAEERPEMVRHRLQSAAA